MTTDSEVMAHMTGETQAQAANVATAHTPAAPLLRAVPQRRGLAGVAQRHPTLLLGAILLLIMVLIAISAPWLGTVDPTAIAPSQRIRSPSMAHLFGTDMLGRDIYSRVLYGARVSLAVGFSVALLSTVLGLLVGVLSGYFRWIDNCVMRINDGLMAIPSILLAISLMALTRASMGNVILAVTIAELPRTARMVRGVVLSTKEQPYVDAAITVGTRLPRLIWRHIIPSTLAPVAVQASYICASAMLIEASLSFIGVGTPPIIPSWGNIMSDGRSLWQIKPFVVFIPAAFLSLTVLAVNMVGDGLRDALDPRSSNRR